MNKKGMTLVEIIVAMAIVGIIVIVIGNVFMFGTKSFRKTETQAVNQMDVRVAVSSISKELRYASKIELLDIEKLEDKFHYIYFDNKTKKIMRKEKNRLSEELIVGENKFDKVEFVAKDGLLKAFFKSKDIGTEDNYELDATISLINEKNLSDHKGSKVIKYDK